MEPVVSPENLTVNDKAWNAEYSSRDGSLRLLTQSLLDLNRLSLVQEFLPVDADAVGNLTNNAVRSNISSFTPRRIKKPHGKSLAQGVIVNRRRDPQRFERDKWMCRGSLEFQAEMDSPTLHILIRVTAFSRDFRRPHIRVVVQKSGEKNRHKSELGTCAFPNLGELMRRQPGIQADEVEIKIHTAHEQLLLFGGTSTQTGGIQMPLADYVFYSANRRKL